MSRILRTKMVIILEFISTHFSFLNFSQQTYRSRVNRPFWQVVLTCRFGLSCDAISVLSCLFCSTQSLCLFTGFRNRFWVIFETFSALTVIPLMIKARSDWPHSATTIFHAIIFVFVNWFARVLEENTKEN